jgi:hypothetical protein
MALWAALLAIALGLWTYLAEDPTAVMVTIAELGGVIGLFALVCAAEAWN